MGCFLLVRWTVGNSNMGFDPTFDRMKTLSQNISLLPEPEFPPMPVSRPSSSATLFCTDRNRDSGIWDLGLGSDPARIHKNKNFKKGKRKSFTKTSSNLVFENSCLKRSPLCLFSSIEKTPEKPLRKYILHSQCNAINFNMEEERKRTYEPSEGATNDEKRLRPGEPKSL